MTAEKEHYSQVKVEGEETPVIVPVTSSSKPEIPAALQEKWQKILDLIAEILQVPSALIMKLEHDSITVYRSSNTQKNPYHKNDSEKLGLGLYCETVVGNREKLLVPNALDSDYWRTNPDVKLHMISYLGFPIIWDDGEVFGTFCVLDNKENRYSQLYIDVLQEFKNIVESDMHELILYTELQDKLSRNDLIIREIHHRIKNHFNLLISSIRLQAGQVDTEQKFQRALEDISSRIRAISLIHDKLYMSEDISHLSLKEYLTELCRQIMSNLSAHTIDFHLHSDSIILDEDLMVPLGLIFSELLTNSIKHAFHATAKPRIDIMISSVSEKEISLWYKDNGPGLPEGGDLESYTSFGMVIIKTMIEQLSSDIIIGSGPGFSCEFIVPIT